MLNGCEWVFGGESNAAIDSVRGLLTNTGSEMLRHITRSSIERLLKLRRGLKQRESSKRRRMPGGTDAKSANANGRWTPEIPMIGVGWRFSTQNQWI
jgi:hypothetical protein